MTAAARSLRIGVAVLSYEPGETILSTLACLLASSRPPDDVVVVDNASSDLGLEALVVTYPSIPILRLPTNVGYGAAMNAAAAHLAGRGCDTFLFLTHETEVAASLLGDLATELERNPTWGVIGPLLCRRGDRTAVWSAGGYITRLRRVPRHVDSTPPPGIPRPSVAVQWLDGACLLVRSEAFTAAHGFRSDLFLYWEDVALCRRLTELGWDVMCATDVIAYQEPSMTPPYLFARNRALVLGAGGYLAGVIDVVLRLPFDLIRGRGVRRVGLLWRGLIDARRNRLNRDVALERP